jgi:osmoprotectant transport system permease protein
MTGPRNKMLFGLTVIGAVAALAGGFLTQAPNRLVSGRPIGLAAAVEPAMLAVLVSCAVLLLAASFAAPARRIVWTALAIAALLLLLVIDGAGSGAARLLAGAPAAARVSLGWAFWVIVLCAGFAIVDSAQRLRLSPGARLGVAIVLLAAIAALFASGRLDQLSILREYEARREAFASALGAHAGLVVGSLVPALVIGVALGALASRRPRLQAPLFGTLNLLQTIPSVALFGLLIAPLSALALAIPALGALGIHGVGAAPAIIALTLYALLPVARNSLAGIEAADPAIVAAARGLGFTPSQIFWRAQLPLGLPVFLAGLRIVLVQTIGLAVIAALIGGGGLGNFIFQGIGQYAIDLVLLGAIPTTALALAADFLMQLAIAALDRRAAA